MSSERFRQYHLLRVLESYSEQSLPLDRILSAYCREHKALGSKDRRFLADTAYELMRWRGLVDTQIDSSKTWEKRIQAFLELDINQQLTRQDLPLHVQCSCPESLWSFLSHDYGEKKALELCLALNTQAPTTIRTNTVKISRNELMQQLAFEGYTVTPTRDAPEGITFNQRINFLGMAAFKKGLFEVQDEASQLAAERVQSIPGDHILDYCAGAGGKSLAIAPKMKNRGQLYLHDIRQRPLIEAKKRLRRAGIQNFQIIDSKNLQSLKRRCQWVFVDAPCSGSGTWRRKPDMKWHFNEVSLKETIALQQEVFSQALRYLRPGGQIVYATCSFLKCENEEQVEYFCKEHNLEICQEPFLSLPHKGGMDGFFAVTLKKTTKNKPSSPQ